MENISEAVVSKTQEKGRKDAPPPESDCNIIANSNRCVILRSEGNCVAGIKKLGYIINCSGKSYRSCGKCRCNSVEEECERKIKKTLETEGGRDVGQEKKRV